MFKWLKKYFIPHEGNDYRPHFLRYQTITLLLFAVIVIEVGFLVQVFVVFDQTKFLASVLPGVLTSLTNDARAENNLPPLAGNPLLDEAARRKAEDMATLGYFAHTSPSGVTPWSWLSQVGYRYAAAGENLAVNFFDSEDVAEAWMNSPSHRANIVRSDFTEIGIGVAKGTYQGRSTVFVAQFFGKPLTAYAALPTPEGIPDASNGAGGTPASPPANVGATPEPSPAPGTTPPSAPLLSEGGDRGGNPPTPLTVLGSEASVKTESLAPNPIKTSLQKTLTSPRQSISYVYLMVALLLILAILLTFFIRIERQHPAFLARGAALFAVVALLLFVDMRIRNFETEVPDNLGDLTANVIYAAE